MQERATGLITGIEEFILANNAPVALDMPCETYDSCFVTPWASDRNFEATHRELTKSVGQTLKGIFVGL